MEDLYTLVISWQRADTRDPLCPLKCGRMEQVNCSSSGIKTSLQCMKQNYSPWANIGSRWHREIYHCHCRFIQYRLLLVQAVHEQW